MAIDIGTTIATIKAIAGVAKDAGRIDLYSDIIGLQSAILEAISENTKLAQENASLFRDLTELGQKCAALEAKIALKEELTFRNEAYWRIKEGQQDEGPFCPRCFDGEGKVSRMTDRGNGFTCCVVCKFCIGRARAPRPHGTPRSGFVGDW